MDVWHEAATETDELDEVVVVDVARLLFEDPMARRAVVLPK